MTTEDKLRRIDAIMNWRETHEKVVWELRKSEQSRLKEVFMKFFNHTEKIYAEFDLQLQDAQCNQTRALQFIEDYIERYKGDTSADIGVLQIVKNILSGN